VLEPESLRTEVRRDLEASLARYHAKPSQGKWRGRSSRKPAPRPGASAPR
jgi:hypothetical protein